jgi:hypothetical protein
MVHYPRSGRLPGWGRTTAPAAAEIPASKQFGSLPTDVTEKITRENASKFYG